MHDPAELLFVPIKAPRSAGVASIRTARLPAGGRAAVAFTSVDRLTAAMGDQQAWTVMCEAALRTVVAPIGVCLIQVDADYVGPAVSRLPAPASHEPLEDSVYPLNWLCRAHAVA